MDDRAELATSDMRVTGVDSVTAHRTEIAHPLQQHTRQLRANSNRSVVDVGAPTRKDTK